MRNVLACIALIFLAACERADEMPPVSERAPGYVDSIFPPEEELRRFRAGLEEPRGLSGGAESHEALVRAFASALADADTAALRGLVLDRAELAWLYYPTSPVSREPQYLSPALLWFQVQANGEKGIVRALQRYADTGFRYVSHACEGQPKTQGENRLWEACTVTFTAGGETWTRRLFGSVIERGGRFKLVSYANDL
jgi:hypothetical protein